MGDCPGENAGACANISAAATAARASHAFCESSARCSGAWGWSPCRSRCKFSGRPAS